MEAFNRMLYEDIIKKTDVQYTIPVYQRNYTWEKSNCDKLYDDIINSVKQNKTHFLGSLVYSTTKRSDIKSCPIIDGQQRLTTVMLLLKAIDDSIEDDENITKKKIRKNLYNELCEERYKLKLKNTENDNEELENVLMGNNVSLDNTSKIVINYNHFKNRIKKSVQKEKLTYEDLLNGIAKLEIVEVVLSENDSAQKIFESINSTGVKLTTADLIRNFLLMGIMDASKQAEIYKKYWVTLENLITKEHIEKFFHNFLVAKDTRYIEETKVYERFKEYYMNNNIENSGDVEKILNEIIKFAKYYKLLVCNDSTDYGDTSNNLCKLFNILQHRTIYPFLLRVCEDFDIVQKKYDKELSLSEEEIKMIDEKEEEFNRILKLFGNYALRRSVTDVSSSSLRRFYASLYSRIFDKNKRNYNCYYKAVEAYLCTLKTDDRMPNDNKFNDGLHYENLYVSAKLKILRYFFEIIENDNKEPVNMESLTIEHIMPETLSKKWQEALGEKYQEIYDKYVHTLGNLSITGYNSEFSNDPFEDKKKQFKKLVAEGKAKIITLNSELMDDSITSWGEKEIKQRADRLSKLIIEKFPYPKDIDTSLEFEKYYEFYLDDSNENGDEYANGSAYKVSGFSLDGIKYRATSFRSIYKDIIKILYKMDNTILDDMAKRNLTYERGTRILFSQVQVNETLEEILPNLYVFTGYDRNSIFEWIRYLLDKYQIELQDFSILFVEKEDQ